MGSKRARKLKNAEPKMARLKALNVTMLVDGRQLVPGTPEHDRELQKLAGYLSEEDLAAMEARDAG